MINSDKNNGFIYESKIESLSFLKDLALIFAKPAAVVYTALVLLFAFLEQGINKIVFLVPLLILSAVFFNYYSDAFYYVYLGSFVFTI